MSNNYVDLLDTHESSKVPTAEPAMRAVHLSIQGMTCASCVGRVERKLRKIGADASVNLPLESARVLVPDTLSDQQIIDTVNAAGYSASLKTTATVENSVPTRDTLLPRLWVAIVLSLPIFCISMVPALQFPHWGWAVAVLTLPVATWCAAPFHSAAFKAARHGSSTMDTLVSLGVISAYGYSLVQLLLNPMLTAHVHTGHHAPLYFDSASMVTAFLLAGRVVEHRTRAKSSQALKALLALAPAQATLLRTDKSGTTREIVIDAADIVPGDIFLVRPGEQIATDGTVLEGASAVDCSMLTGESVPVSVSVGDDITGGTVNTSGALRILAERVGAETTLAQMTALVSKAQESKAPVARLADRVSAVFVPTILLLALLTLIGWLVFSGDVSSAFNAAVSVVLIACPCALGLATPTALLAGTGRGSQLGILISNARALEGAGSVDTVVFDKTGTLTSGSMSVVHAARFRAIDLGIAPLLDSKMLALAATAESLSEHPIARAIVAASEDSSSPNAYSYSASDFEGVPGGVSALVHSAVEDGSSLQQSVMVGSPRFVRERGVRLIDSYLKIVENLQQQGLTVVILAVDGQPAGVLCLQDTLKPDAARAVELVQAAGIEVHLASGDAPGVVSSLAEQLGIAPERVHAQMTPADKAELIATLQAAGRRVAMVGDGVNDAPALAGATVGIAMAAGTDVAAASADVVLMRSDVLSVVRALRLSRATLGTIRSNLWWAFGYNLVAIPVAMAGLLNPMVAGAAMAASSVLVVANSVRLTRFDR